jgi:hypothetical protein
MVDRVLAEVRWVQGRGTGSIGCPQLSRTESPKRYKKKTRRNITREKLINSKRLKSVSEVSRPVQEPLNWHREVFPTGGKTAGV